MFAQKSATNIANMAGDTAPCSNIVRERMTSKIPIAYKIIAKGNYILSKLWCERLSYLPTANL